jgi:hypothetical protein
MGDSEMFSCSCVLEFCVAGEVKEGVSSFWDYSLMTALCLWKSWFSNEFFCRFLWIGCFKDMVTFMGPQSCLVWRICSANADWGLLNLMYVIVLYIFVLYVDQFGLYTRGYRCGIVISRSNCTCMYWCYLFEIWVCHGVYYLCGMWFRY